MSEQFHWSESAQSYVRNAHVNRRYLGNDSFLISLGVSEQLVTGYVNDSGVSFVTRLAMLQPSSRRANRQAWAALKGGRGL